MGKSFSQIKAEALSGVKRRNRYGRLSAVTESFFGDENTTAEENINALWGIHGATIQLAQNSKIFRRGYYKILDVCNEGGSSSRDIIAKVNWKVKADHDYIDNVIFEVRLNPLANNRSKAISGTQQYWGSVNGSTPHQDILLFKEKCHDLLMGKELWIEDFTLDESFEEDSNVAITYIFKYRILEECQNQSYDIEYQNFLNERVHEENINVVLLANSYHSYVGKIIIDNGLYYIEDPAFGKTCLPSSNDKINFSTINSHNNTNTLERFEDIRDARLSNTEKLRDAISHRYCIEVIYRNNNGVESKRVLSHLSFYQPTSYEEPTATLQKNCYAYMMLHVMTVPIPMEGSSLYQDYEQYITAKCQKTNRFLKFKVANIISIKILPNQSIALDEDGTVLSLFVPFYSQLILDCAFVTRNKESFNKYFEYVESTITQDDFSSVFLLLLIVKYSLIDEEFSLSVDNVKCFLEEIRSLDYFCNSLEQDYEILISLLQYEYEEVKTLISIIDSLKRD